MKNLKLFEGDIVINNREIQLVHGEDELVQVVQYNLTQNIGEWFLDPTQGLDFYSILGNKDANEEQIRLALIECIMQESRVKRVNDINFEVDRLNRKLKVNFSFTDNEGNLIEGGI